MNPTTIKLIEAGTVPWLDCAYDPSLKGKERGYQKVSHTAAFFFVNKYIIIIILFGGLFKISMHHRHKD